MLQLKNIRKSFANGSGMPILKGINLSIRPKDFCVIIGGNGSGKSTLLKIILGVLKPDAGNVYLNQIKMTDTPLSQRITDIRCVFQNLDQGSIAQMTVEENLQLALQSTKETFKQKQPHLRTFFQNHLSTIDVGLEDRLDHPCSHLSGGQRQALAFAMATLSSPRVLLLDEHCSALDPKSAQKIMSATSTFIENHEITTLMVTHNLREALHYGNRLIMLHQGTIVLNVEGDDKKKLSTDCLFELFVQNTTHEELP